MKSKKTIFGLGCGHLHIEGFKNGVELVRYAFLRGIRYFDVATSYPDFKENRGLNEKILREGLGENIKRAFVATKIISRDYENAKKEFLESLNRLEKIDMVQLHSVDDRETLNLVKNGALKFLVDIKKEKKIKFIGLTNHYDPKITLLALKKFKEIDSFMIPINIFNFLVKRKNFEKIIPLAKRKKKKIIAMLVFGCGLLKDFPDLALKYAYTKKPHVILIGAKNVNELKKDLKIIKNIKRINKREFNLLKEIGKKILKEDKNKAWCLNGHIGAFPFGKINL